MPKKKITRIDTQKVIVTSHDSHLLHDQQHHFCLMAPVRDTLCRPKQATGKTSGRASGA